MHHPIDRIAHAMSFVTPALAGTRNSSMGPSCMLFRSHYNKVISNENPLTYKFDVIFYVLNLLKFH